MLLRTLLGSVSSFQRPMSLEIVYEDNSPDEKVALAKSTRSILRALERSQNNELLDCTIIAIHSCFLPGDVYGTIKITAPALNTLPATPTF